LGNLGICYAMLGQTQTAIEHHHHALAIGQEIGQRRGEATELLSLGLCYAALGRTRTASDHPFACIGWRAHQADRRNAQRDAYSP
jgi:Tetratricopeptide repeat